MRTGPGPEHVLAEGREWVLLVVAEDLEHDGLALDVFDEGLGHLHGNLVARWAGDQRGARGLHGGLSTPGPDGRPHGPEFRS